MNPFYPDQIAGIDSVQQHHGNSYAESLHCAITAYTGDWYTIFGCICDGLAEYILPFPASHLQGYVYPLLIGR